MVGIQSYRTIGLVFPFKNLVAEKDCYSFWIVHSQHPNKCLPILISEVCEVHPLLVNRSLHIMCMTIPAFQLLIWKTWLCTSFTRASHSGTDSVPKHNAVQFALVCQSETFLCVSQILEISQVSQNAMQTGASQKHWVFMLRQLNLQHLPPENVAGKGNQYAKPLCSVCL